MPPTPTRGNKKTTYGEYDRNTKNRPTGRVLGYDTHLISEEDWAHDKNGSADSLGMPGA